MNAIARFFLSVAEMFADNVRIPLATIHRSMDEADTDHDGNLSLKEMIEAVHRLIGVYFS